LVACGAVAPRRAAPHRAAQRHLLGFKGHPTPAAADQFLVLLVSFTLEKVEPNF